VAGTHIRKKGRDRPVMLEAQRVQLTELLRVGEWPVVVNAAYLSPSVYDTVCYRQYGVEGRLST
jgi:hypothetical protein